jgi:hypothetical protein
VLDSDMFRKGFQIESLTPSPAAASPAHLLYPPAAATLARF